MSEQMKRPEYEVLANELYSYQKYAEELNKHIDFLESQQAEEPTEVELAEEYLKSEGVDVEKYVKRGLREIERFKSTEVQSVEETRDKVEDIYIKETGRFAFLDNKKLDSRYIEWLEKKIYQYANQEKLPTNEEIEKQSRKFMQTTMGGGDAGWIKGAFVDGAKWVINKMMRQ